MPNLPGFLKGRSSSEKEVDFSSRAAKWAEYLPVVTIIIGFALIGLGWNGAASIDYMQGQLPYLISGGLAGLAFVFYGSAALVVRALKKGNQDQRDQLEEITQTLHRVASAMTIGGNGEVQNGELVIVGSSSFHLPGCRTIGERSDLLKVPRSEALAEGLEACRVCKP
jgi:hypothetical protein